MRSAGIFRNRSPLASVCVVVLWSINLNAACSGPASIGRAASSSSFPSSTQIVGAWRPIELALRTPGQDWEIRPTPRGLYVFSDRHYSYSYIPGGRARPQFTNANSPTEAEKAAAYDTFIAGAGSYTFDGSVLELKADVRKNPNEMTGQAWRWKLERAGKDTLQFIFENPPFLPGRDWRTILARVP